MATSEQIEIDGTALKVVPSRQTNAGFGRPGRQTPIRYVTVKNMGAAMAFIGGSNVSVDNGLSINVNGTFNLQLGLEDEIWAVTAGSATTVSYIETGGVSV